MEIDNKVNDDPNVTFSTDTIHNNNNNNNNNDINNNNNNNDNNDSDDEIMDFKEDDSVLYQTPKSPANNHNNKQINKIPEKSSQSKPQSKSSISSPSSNINPTNNNNLSLNQINAKIQKALEIFEINPSEHSSKQLAQIILTKRDKIYEIYKNNNNRNPPRFDITRRGNFFTQNLKPVNLHAHISPIGEYIEQQQQNNKTLPNPAGTRKPPKITFQCDSFARSVIDSHAMSDILSELVSQDNSGNLYHLVPGQFDLRHPSITKIEIQLKENLDFEKYCTNFKNLESELNEILSYQDQLVTMQITPRLTEFPPFIMCLPDFDPNIRSKSRIMNIIDTTIRCYYQNKFWYGSQKLKSSFDLNNVEIVDFTKI